MSPSFSFNPPAGSPENATIYVTEALQALACESTLKPRQVSTILLCNWSKDTLYRLALYQVRNNASLVASGLAAAKNKYYEPLHTMFRNDPILAILLRSDAGKEALYTALNVTRSNDSQQFQHRDERTLIPWRVRH